MDEHERLTIAQRLVIELQLIQQGNRRRLAACSHDAGVRCR
jgi:hypothetical protein